MSVAVSDKPAELFDVSPNDPQCFACESFWHQRLDSVVVEYFPPVIILLMRDI